MIEWISKSRCELKVTSKMVLTKEEAIILIKEDIAHRFADLKEWLK